MFANDKESDVAAQPAPGQPSAFLEEKALRARSMLVFGTITDALASETVRRLLVLDAESAASIDMIVSSPGGHLESGDAIHDVVRFIAAPVNMIGTGWVGSAATHLYRGARARAALLPAADALPDPPAERRRERPGQRYRDPGQGGHQGTGAHRRGDRPRMRAAPGARAGGYRARSLDAGGGGGEVWLGGACGGAPGGTGGKPRRVITGCPKAGDQGSAGDRPFCLTGFDRPPGEPDSA